LLDYEQPSKYIVDSDEYENDQTLIPVLTANKAFILGYTNESFGVYDKDECIILDDFTLDSKYVTFKFKVKSSAIKILTPKYGANLRYIFEYMQYKDMISTEHKRHYISEVEPMEICYPDDKITRNKIVSLLASYQDKLLNATYLLNQYNRQKTYLLSTMFI
jgi:type I restriction enzyme S subunit